MTLRRARAGPRPASRAADRPAAARDRRVLLVSCVTWFGTGQQLVGIGQLVLGAGLAVAGGLLYRRAAR